MSELASDQLTPGNVARKTAHGAFALGVRQILVQGTRILGGIFLARLLTPTQFGFYAIVLYFQMFLTAFGDAGLAASLVRQHEEPETVDYRAIFTMQQMLVLLTAVLLWLAAPSVASWYHLKPQDAWLFRLVSLSFFVTSFMVIPQVRLERHLAFHELAGIESAQAVVFNGLAVYLAWKGLGAYAFAWALLSRSIVGAGLANWISPWKMGWHWDWPLIRGHLSFGLSYQGISVTSLLKDSITPVFIGVLVGTDSVGYLTWAGMLAAYPVLALTVLQRLYMPAFARLQRHPAQLVALAENVVWATNAITAPLAVLTLAMIVPITTAVYGTKWLVALPFFYLLWPVNLAVASATPAMGLLNALGKSRVVLVFAIIWMAGTWVIGAPLIWFFGPIGFPIASLIVLVSNYWLFKAVQRQVAFRLLPIVTPVWVIASISGALVWLACRLRVPVHMTNIAIYAAGGLLVYGSGVMFFYKNKIHAAWSSFREAQLKPRASASMNAVDGE